MTETEKKITELERSVLLDSPEDLDRTCKRLGDMYGKSRALGLACHFRGLDWVKVLVNNGFVFKREDMRLLPSLCYISRRGDHYFSISDNFMFCLLNLKILLRSLPPQLMDKGETEPSDHIFAFEGEIDAVSEEERLKCVKYFIELSNNEICDLQELLYNAIIYCDFKVTELLREKGITIAQSTREMMLIGDYTNQTYFFRNTTYMSANEFIQTVTELSKDLGENKVISGYIRNIEALQNKLIYDHEPESFECFLTHFDTKRISQKKTMQEIILSANPALLTVCEKLGWLKMQKKRDELIQFAADNDKKECTAWLLEFKKRTADPKAEQEKAEKKLKRELNADPYSVTEMKKIWGFEKREDGGIVITRYKGKRDEVNVPDRIGRYPVREIGKEAFSTDALRLTKEQKNLRRSITKITLPKTLEAIGEGAFYGCKRLFSINIPEGTKEIGANAFSGCQSLSEINIPLSVKEIGESAFYGCTSLISIDIPRGITKISGGCFAGCTSLEKITIPPNIKKIGDWAFRNCIFLEEAIISEGVEEIGNIAFYHCLRLLKINIPLSVKEIGENAFPGCKSLISIDLPHGITEISNGCFAECKALKKITIPPTVKKIGNMAFIHCCSVEEIRIPEGVEEICDEAFIKCCDLRSVTLPKSVRSIWFIGFISHKPKTIFDGCENLTVTVPAESYSEEYCKKNNIPYIIMEENND